MAVAGKLGRLGHTLLVWEIAPQLEQAEEAYELDRPCAKARRARGSRDGESRPIENQDSWIRHSLPQWVRIYILAVRGVGGACVCFGGGLVPKRVVTSVRSDKMETKSRKKKRDKKYPGRPIEYPKYNQR